MSLLTDYHAKLFASELTRQCPSDSVEKLTAVLSDAQVDLNPHQIDAALFAFANPLSRGAILADEVGLGKTIEAGLLLAQMWAERKRRLLVIVPANLRKQWAQELADKFFLPSAILEARTFNETVKCGNLNPFSQDAVIICSYHFARRMEPYLRQTGWDLVVIDEAHRLRNVYKPQNKIANAIRDALRPYKKVLLTATPLQNSLLELYGLVSIIDEYAFGDLGAFRARFTRLAENEDFQELKERLAPICKRTLRKQVLEYVRYTDRHAIVQEFVPSEEEQQLYDLVTEYLQQETLYALPASQRKLMTLILRKLLASSTYAISGTLAGLSMKLEQAEREATSIEMPPDDLGDNYEEYDDLVDEWDDDEPTDPAKEKLKYTPEQLAELRAERDKLKKFHELAHSIVRNSKGEVLLTALRRGFEAAGAARERKGETGANAAALQSKAIIFTESRRTQEYLYRILQQTEFAGKVVLFNGTNSDPNSKGIYRNWSQQHAGTDKISGSPAADMRQALVEHFRDEAQIMIATEAAAEGINLQFCNLVVNYDLPWNPQRIEQRIGRCHRYGQKCDVVVVNFLNKNNAADLRVYELLAEKFKLFDGVFGSSDEVLGAVESGVDFEKRIAAIYERCRTPEQIAKEFDQLQHDLDAKIAEGKRDAREKLLDNFDQEVVEKVKVQTKGLLDRFNEQLWRVTRHVLNDHARFDGDEYSFYLTNNPFPGDTIYPGPYRLGRAVEDANTFRVGHPLAQRLLEKAKTLGTPTAELIFDYTGTRKKIAVLDELVGSSGWLAAEQLAIASLDAEDVILLAGFSDAGQSLDANQCRRLFDLPAEVIGPTTSTDAISKNLRDVLGFGQSRALESISSRNAHWFDLEMEKLDRWADDLKDGIEREIQDLSTDIKTLKREARTVPSLEQKVALQREVKDKERNLRDKRKARDEAQDEIEEQKESLLATIEARMAQKVVRSPLFTIRWRIA
ncbi:MAG: SNF2-related protein [Planctomycetota bacterium]|nr:SNF2-related protein [Planctomycetota bacterium]